MQNPCCSEIKPHVVGPETPLTVGSGQPHWIVSETDSQLPDSGEGGR